MHAADLLNLLIAALLLAGLYAAMSVGMTIIYGVMKIVNLAHAGFMMLGAYFVLELHERLGMDPLIGVLFAFPVFFLGGMLVYWLLVRWIPMSDQPTLASLLLMFGLWLVLQNIGYLVWGNSDRAILTARTFRTVHLGPILIPYIRLVVFAAAASSLAVLELTLRKTWFGMSVRALMQNQQAGRIVGIHVERTTRRTFGLGTAFAGAAGGLLAMLYSFSPDFGRPFLLRSFVIIVLGGLESFSGVAVGALILALVETLSILVLPAGYQPAIAFGLLVLALVLLPGGVATLFQKRQRLA
jgi:branched-chain amino acid transport system permease protein